MSDVDDRANDVLSSLRRGDLDAARCLAAESVDAIVPPLVAAFRASSDPCLRAGIVHVVWQRRSETSLAFLGEAVRDSERTVWQEALDGLVTLASPDARAALVAARDRETDAERRAWIDEAIDQIDESAS